MQKKLWQQVIGVCADPARARHCLSALQVTDAGKKLADASREQMQLLAAVFSGSQALGNLLLANPDWLEWLEPERIKFPRREQGFRHEIDGWLKLLFEAKDYAGALARLRQFKQREMLRIAARDLARLSNVPEITREISDVADVCLETVWQICRRQFTERFGQPYHQDASERWQPTQFCVLGMGKLGGQELNYSSDVDVLFVYSDEGQVFKEPPAKTKTPRATLSNHQFFNRLSEAFIAEVSRATADGFLFRIDLRLRPEGDTGPLSRSLGSYENYYAQWGQTWERMMLIKARHVAGDAGLAGEFAEMFQSFRYPRTVSTGVLHEIAAVKDRIENEVVREGELERNVKLGRGGIREIEFVVQSLQLLHAGKQPFLQGAQTLPGLEKLAQYNLLSNDEAHVLREAYLFLRDVEHRLQMEDNLQTHTIPTDAKAQERLARLMGFKSTREFETARQTQTNQVRQIFDKFLKAKPSEIETRLQFPREFANAESEWKNILTEHSFKDADKAFRVLREFAEGPGYIHVSPRTVELAHKLLGKFFALCPKQSTVRNPQSTILSDPDRVVTRLDSFIAVYGARATLFELWNSNPAIFEMLLFLFDRSEFLAELAIRTPDLVDDLVTSGRLRQSKSAAETLRDLRYGLDDADQFLWLRRYHQTELMRIGLRDILGLADFEQFLTELSTLADACLQYALEVVMRKNKIKTPPFVILGLGKLGGMEIDYGSDLDIIFVADTNSKNLPKIQKFAIEVKDLISNRTEAGIVFQTDARLRPDGEKGLLVNTLEAYEEYYCQRAQLWEIQSISRTRPIAGDMKLGAQFQELAARLTNFKNVPAVGDDVRRLKLSGRKISAKQNEPPHVVSYTPRWKKEIHAMRMRIEKERTPRGQDDLAIKTGKGGLMDAEFIAQALCLENGWQEANTLRALERGQKSKLLPEAEKLITNYRQLRRVEGILRRWSNEGEVVLPDDPAPYYRVSVRCGFASPEEFRTALAKWRRAIREVYEKLFDVSEKLQFPSSNLQRTSKLQASNKCRRN